MTDSNISTQKQKEHKLELHWLPPKILELTIAYCKDPQSSSTKIAVNLTSLSYFTDKVSLEKRIEKVINTIIYTTTIGVTVNDAIEVCKFGAKKYAKFNWKLGTNWSYFFDAALRHIAAHLAGEEIDSESGLPHLSHAVINLGILHYYITKNVGVDDLTINEK